MGTRPVCRQSGAVSMLAAGYGRLLGMAASTSAMVSGSGAIIIMVRPPSNLRSTDFPTEFQRTMFAWASFTYPGLAAPVNS